MRYADFQKPLNEDATAGATSAGAIATVVAPITTSKKKNAKPVVIRRIPKESKTE